MSLPITLALLLASAALTVFCGWMGAKPKNYAKPSLVPWQFLMLLSAAMVLIMVVGLLNELGITTGGGH